MNYQCSKLKGGSLIWRPSWETLSNPSSYLKGFDAVFHQILKIVYMVIMNDNKKDKKCEKGHQGEDKRIEGNQEEI